MGGAVGAALLGLSASLARLTDAPLAGLSGEELLELADELEAHRRRLAVVDYALVAELAERGVAREVGARDTADLLVQRLRVSRRTARNRVADAQEFGPRRGLTGEVLPPKRAAVAAAQAEGALDDDHAHLIAKALDALPLSLDGETVERAERCLVERARELDPGQLRVVAQRLLDHLDPDGRLATDADHQRRRTLWLERQPDGSAELSGHLTPEAGAKLQVVLDALSAPTPPAEGELDARSATQRRHDALVDVLDRVLRSGRLPDTGGTATTLVLTANAADLERGTGRARTEHGDGLDLELALRLGDTAEVQLVVFDDATGEVSLGRTSRLARPAQRRALAARDRGCSFPNCTAPPSWCQAHHVIAWLDGGPTDLDNLTLLCGHHHRSFAASGWQCVMRDGRPYWIPPTWLDATQTPRRNRAQHLDEYDLSQAVAAVA